MVRKRALITGCTGQDGSYLAELLLRKGYEVHGLIRPSTRDWPEYFDSELQKRCIFHLGNVNDAARLTQLIGALKPDEIYNLAAMSFVKASFDMVEHTFDTDALGTVRILEAIRSTGKPIKFYQASTSEMFGAATESPQKESTPFHPRSPYGCAKVAAYWATVNYREAFNMFACNGILFNHESPRRGEQFVTRKVTKAVARIKNGLQNFLHLGNLEARRDWGFARDYVEAMWLMLQQDKPDDFVIATGQSYSIIDLLDTAFGCCKLDWRDYVKVKDEHKRPSDVDMLKGDATKAKIILGWQPKTHFHDLIKMMVFEDLELCKNIGTR